MQFKKIWLLCLVALSSNVYADEQCNALFNAKKYKEAFPICQKAADKGEAVAQNHVGGMYSRGWGVPLNYKKAFKWYTKSVEQGNSHAENNLGYMYLNGLGIAQDNSKGLELVTKSAKQGYTAGQLTLGLLYSKGQGVTQSFEMAYVWFSVAAHETIEGVDLIKIRDGTGMALTDSQIAKAKVLADEYYKKYGSSYEKQ